MSNAYWNFLAPIARFTLGRAETLNSLFQGIAAGFDKIPDIGEFVNNTGDYAVASGTGNPYIVTLKPDQIISYTEGLRVRFKANVSNPSGGASINVNGIGVKPIITSQGSALAEANIPADSIVDVSYDGTAFRISLSVQPTLAVAYAQLDGATFTGAVKVPTPSTATNSTDAVNVTALRAYMTASIDAAIAALVDSSPSTLDTLNELAAALGDDPNFATTMTNVLAGKAAKTTKLIGAGGVKINGGAEATLAADVTISMAGVPTGAVMGFDLDAAPTGWIVGDGSAILRASYPDLDTVKYCGDANNATATAWYRCTNPASPSTSRSTTGNYLVTRDLRGVFTRFLDESRGIDTGRVLGSEQKGTVHSFDTGSAVGIVGDRTAATAVGGVGHEDLGLDYNSAIGTAYPNALQVNTNSSFVTAAVANASEIGAGVVRPINVALLGCIKC